MMTKTFGFVKMPQRRDSAGAVCNSGMGILFDELDFVFRGVYLVSRATFHT